MSDPLPDPLESLFHEAAALAGDARARFLKKRCDGDSRLRARLEMLLEAHDRQDGFLETPETGATLPLSEGGPSSDHLVGARIEQYEIRSLIGTGGMGRVYEAQQDDPRRLVALKVLRAGIASHQASRRFRHEAQVLGELRHPGIAQIYEAGVGEIGGGPRAGERQPFFAMELIRGRPIDTYVQECRIDPRGRLALLAKAADAVQHAHDKGIIHRDLKPGNILVDEFGQPKILDFGVARIVNPDIQVTMQTEAGQIVGTLAYMSPEQVTGKSEEQDPRSDVYSLGVVLYELIAGKAPYDLRGQTIPEAARVIREEEPSRLSSVDSRFRGDIETIVSKAMEKDKSRRYQTAAEFAADIRRYLGDEPLVARPASTFYRIRKYARRHKAAVGVMVALAVGLIGTATFAFFADRQRRIADHRADLLQREAYRANIAAARGALIDHDSASAMRYLEAAPPALRGWEWRWRRSLYTEPPPIHAVPPGLRCLGLAGDAIVYARGGEVFLFDMRTGRERHRVRLCEETPYWIAIAPSGDAVLVRREDAVELVSLPSGAKRWSRALAGLTSFSERHTFTGDGRLLVVADRAAQVLVLDAASGKTVQALDCGGALITAAISPDGRIVLAERPTGDWVQFDRASGRVLCNTETDRAPLFSADGARFLAFIAPNFVARELRVHDAGNCRIITSIDVRRGALTATFRSNGATLATIEHATELTIREGSQGDVLALIRTPELPLGGMEYSRDGSLLAVSSQSGFQAWDVLPSLNPIVVAWKFTGESHSQRRISSDGRHVAVSNWGSVTLLDAVRGGCAWTRCLPSKQFGQLAISPDSRSVAVCVDGPRVMLLAAADGIPRATSDRLDCGKIVSMDWTPDGRRLVAATDAHVVVVLDGQSLRPIPGVVPVVTSLTGAWMTDDESGVVLCTGRDSLTALLPDETGGDWRLQPRRLEGRIDATGAVAVAPARTHLAASDAGGNVFVWQLPVGRVVARVAVSARGVSSLAFSRDGSRLAAGTPDQTALIDTTNWEWVDSLPLNEQRAECIRFAPGDHALIASCMVTPVVRFETRLPDDIPADELLAARETNRRAVAVLAGIPLELRSVLDETLAQIEQLPSLAPEVRQAAVAFARGLGENANWLNSEAWGQVRYPGQPVEQYRKALKCVEAALKYAPGDFAFLNTLGVAQFRLGDFEAAIATLERADSAHDRIGVDGESRGPHPLDGVFASMALARLGRIPEARQRLAAARQLAGDPRYSGDAELGQFLREAEAVIAEAR